MDDRLHAILSMRHFAAFPRAKSFVYDSRMGEFKVRMFDPTKFQHPTQDFEHGLNVEGDDGWELGGIIHDGPAKILVIFKRRK